MLLTQSVAEEIEEQQASKYENFNNKFQTG